MIFSRDELNAARNADLAGVCRNSYSYLFRARGSRLELLADHHIAVLGNHYYDVRNGRGGNAISFLTDVLGLPFSEAVQELLAAEGYSAPAAIPATVNNQRDEGRKTGACPTSPPRATTPPQSVPELLPAVRSYLAESRVIPEDIVDELIDRRLVFAARYGNHANAVFVSPDNSFAEIRGIEPGSRYHQVFRAPSCRRPFWFWGPASGKADNIYLCESSIDAVSLYALQRIADSSTRNAYVSICGAGKQEAIRMIAARRSNVILAVDNDAAGQACRDRNPDLPAILPAAKDWNDDLKRKRSD